MTCDFTKELDWFDLALVTVAGKELYAPKELLTHYSPYFRSLFSGRWVSTNKAELVQFSSDSVLLLLNTLSCQSTVLFSEKQKKVGAIDPKVLVEFYCLAEFLAIEFLLDPIRQGIFSHQYMAASMDRAVLAKKTDLIIDWVAVPDGYKLLTCISQKGRNSMLFSKENVKKIHMIRTQNNFPKVFRESVLEDSSMTARCSKTENCQSIHAYIPSSKNLEQSYKLEASIEKIFESDQLSALEVCARLGLHSSTKHILRSINFDLIVQFINSSKTIEDFSHQLFATSPDSALVSIQHIEIIEGKLPLFYHPPNYRKRKLDDDMYE